MIREDEREKVNNVAQLREYLRGRIGGDGNLLMWSGTYDSNTGRYEPKNSLSADKGVTMMGHGENGWISNTEALVIAIPPFALHFRINGHNIVVKHINPEDDLSELYPELKRVYEAQGYGELPATDVLKFERPNIKWNNFHIYQLWNMESRPGSSSEARIEIQLPPSRLFFAINGRGLPTNLQIKVTDPHSQLEELYEEIKKKYNDWTGKTLPPRTYAELNLEHGTWETNTYHLFNREDGIGLSKEKPIELNVPPVTWYFKINGHDIAVDATDPTAKLSTLYPELQREYEDQGYGELPAMGDLKFERPNIKWNYFHIYQLLNMEGWPGRSETTPLTLSDSELNAIEDRIDFPEELKPLVEFASNANKHDELAPEFSSANCLNGPSYTDRRYQMPVLLDNLMYNSVQLPENPHSKIPQDVEELKLAICSIMSNSDPPIGDPSFEKFVAGFRGVHEELPAYQAGCTYGEQNENFYVGAAAFVGYVFKFRALNMQWGGNQE